MSASTCHNVRRPSVLSAAYDAANIVVHPSCGEFSSFLVMQHNTTKCAGRNCGDITGKICHSRLAKQPTSIFVVQPQPRISWGVGRTDRVAQQLESHGSPGGGLSQWLCRLQHLLSAVCLEVSAKERAVGDTVR